MPFGASRAGLMSTRVDAIPDSVTNHWLHDEGSGTILGDNIGDEDGTIEGATWQTDEGLDGAYLEYDGTDDKTTIDNPEKFDTDTQSWWGWIRADDPESSEGEFFISVEDITLCIQQNRNGNPENLRFFIIDADGGSNVDILSDVLDVGEWNFFGAVAENGEEAVLYHAGLGDESVSEVGSQNYDQGLSSTVTAVRFGERTGDGNHFEGGMDDVACAVDGVLTQQELTDRFNDTKDNYS